MQKVTPCLWFDDQAEEAVNFYTSIFKNSKIEETARYSEASAEASGRPVGTVMTIKFSLDGQDYLALNGGPIFKFTPAISLIVNCESQEEIDKMWEALGRGGTIQGCGWLTDKYGISWQVVPTVLGELMKEKDAAKKDRVMGALMQMQKLEIDKLQLAHAGK